MRMKKTFSPETKIDDAELLNSSDLNVPVLKSTRLACNFKLLSQMSQECDASIQNEDYGSTLIQDGCQPMQGTGFGDRGTFSQECDTITQDTNFRTCLIKDNDTSIQGADCGSTFIAFSKSHKGLMQDEEFGITLRQEDNIPIQDLGYGATQLTPDHYVATQDLEYRTTSQTPDHHVSMQDAEFGISRTSSKSRPLLGRGLNVLNKKDKHARETDWQKSSQNDQQLTEDVHSVNEFTTNLEIQQSCTGCWALKEKHPESKHSPVGQCDTIHNKDVQFDVGRNERKLQTELEGDTPQHRLLYQKQTDCIIGHDTIFSNVRWSVSDNIDSQDLSVYDGQDRSHLQNLDESKQLQSDGWTGMDSIWPNIWSLNSETGKRFGEPTSTEARMTELESNLTKMSLNENNVKAEDGNTSLNGNSSKAEDGSSQTNIINLNENYSQPDDETLQIQAESNLLSLNLNRNICIPEFAESLETESNIENVKFNRNTSIPEFAESLETESNIENVNFNRNVSIPEADKLLDIESNMVDMNLNGNDDKREHGIDTSNSFNLSSKVTDDKMYNSDQPAKTRSMTESIQTKVENSNCLEEVVTNELSYDIGASLPPHSVSQGHLSSESKSQESCLETECTNYQSSKADPSTNKVQETLRTVKMSTTALEQFNQLLDKNMSELSKTSKQRPCEKLTIPNRGDINSGETNSGQINSGQISSGQINSGQINSGQINSGQFSSNKTISGVLSVGNQSPSLSDASYDSFDFKDFSPNRLQIASTQKEDIDDAQSEQAVGNTNQISDYQILMEANCSPCSEPDISDLYHGISRAEEHLDKQCEMTVAENLAVHINEQETATSMMLNTGIKTNILTEIPVSSAGDHQRIKASLTSFKSDELENSKLDEVRQVNVTMSDKTKGMEARMPNKDKQLESSWLDTDYNIEARTFNKEKFVWDSLLLQGKSQSVPAKIKTSSSQLSDTHDDSSEVSLNSPSLVDESMQSSCMQEVEPCNYNYEGKLVLSTVASQGIATALDDSNSEGKLVLSTVASQGIATALDDSNYEGKLVLSSLASQGIAPAELSNLKTEGKLSSLASQNVKRESRDCNQEAKLIQCNNAPDNLTTEPRKTTDEVSSTSHHNELEQNKTKPDCQSMVNDLVLDSNLIDTNTSCALGRPLEELNMLTNPLDSNSSSTPGRPLEDLNALTNPQESTEDQISCLDLPVTQALVGRTTDLTSVVPHYAVSTATELSTISTALVVHRSMAMLPVTMNIEGAENTAIIGQQIITNESDQNLLSNVTAQTMNELNYEKKLFTKTSSYEVAKDVLTNYGVVFITGPPGSGKTMIARRLVRAVCKSEEQNTWTPLILKFPSEWRYVMPDEKQVILMEDIFGVNSFNTESFYSWSNLTMESLQDVETKRIIFTLRTHILNDASAHLSYFPLFNYSKVVDIVQELQDGRLSISEKCSMLSKHMDDYKLTDKIGTDVVKAITTSQALPNFPSCCKLFCKMRPLHKLENAVHFFNKPVAYFEKEICQLHKEMDKTKFAALVLTMVMDGQLDIDLLDDNNKSDHHKKMRRYLKTVEIADSVTFATIKRSAVNLLGTYLTKTSGNLIEFLHQSIHDAVCLVYGQNNSDYLIEVCSVSFLHEYVLISDNEKSSWMKLVLKPNNRSLSKRFIKEIQDGRPIHVSLHKSFSNDLFLSEFMQTCEEMNVVEILMSSSNCQLPMLYWASWREDFKFFKSILHQHFKQRKLDEDLIFKIANGCCISGNLDVITCIDIGLKPNLLDIQASHVPVPSTSVLNMLPADTDIQSNHVVHAGKLIHVACLHGNHQIVEFLLNKASSTSYRNTLDEFGRTPCHIAARYGHVQVLQTLLDYKCNLCLQNKAGNLPIHDACSTGQIEIVEIILKSFPQQVLEPSADSRTALQFAVFSTNVRLVEMLLNLQPASLIADETYINTLVHKACMQRGNSQVLRMLCQTMKDKHIDFSVDRTLRTPLHVVCEMTADVDMADILIEFEVDVGKTNVKHKTALHLACANNRCTVDLVQLLIENNVNPFIQDVSRRTALDYASHDVYICLQEILQKINVVV